MTHTLILDYASQAKAWRYIDQLGTQTLERNRRSGGRPWVASTCLALGVHRREHDDLESAEQFLTDAVTLFRAMGARHDHARALRELALLRRAQGRADDATRLLQEALANFEAVQARPDSDRTRALLT